MSHTTPHTPMAIGAALGGWRPASITMLMRLPVTSPHTGNCSDQFKIGVVSERLAPCPYGVQAAAVDLNWTPMRSSRRHFAMQRRL